MKTQTNISTRVVAISATIASLMLAANAVMQVTHDYSGETTVIGFIEHLMLAGFSATLIVLIPVVLYLGRAAGRTTAANVVVVGMVGLAIISTISNVRGEDLSIFPFVAISTNLMQFVGLTIIGVALRRRLGVPRWVAIGLPLTMIFGLPLSHFGGTAVAGAYWLALGWLIDSDRLEVGFSSEPRRAVSSQAA
jgi:hypothetical protein